MNPRKTASIIIILACFALTAYYYPKLPDTMANHWDAEGNVNGYSSKSPSVFLIPVMCSGLYLLFLILPKIDPLKKNIELFMREYETFIIIFLTFMLAIQVQTILWNTGTQISMNLTMPLLLAGLFYYIGILMESARRNWFIGIRTPWTLSSDIVWEKTHRLGAKLFKISAGFALISIITPYTILVAVAPILISSLYLFIYSYLEYKKIEK